MSTLADTTARLAELVSRSLDGAELTEFKLKDASDNERRYIVRWTRRSSTAGGFIQSGTHVACLHDDGRSMLVWGHYTFDEDDAVNDYRERT